jgi:hypothetical protein
MRGFGLGFRSQAVIDVDREVATGALAAGERRQLEERHRIGPARYGYE